MNNDRFVQAILDDKELSFGDKGMGLYLHMLSTHGVKPTDPSIIHMCNTLGLSQTTAIKYLKSLSERGYIKKQPRFGATTIYSVHIPESGETANV